MLRTTSLATVPLGLCLALSPQAHAQDGAKPRTLLIQGERVHVRPGEVLEDAGVLVEDGTIVAVGRGLTAPEGAEVRSGVVVTAGFVDPWASIGVERASWSDGRTSFATQATDGLDPYVHPAYREQVLRAGVTSVRLQAGATSKEGGVGAFVRLHPELTGDEAIVLEDCCVAAAIGLTDSGRTTDVFDRIGEVDRLVGAISDGWNYYQNKIEYRDELAEWKKAIAEKEEELEKGFKKAKKDREKDEEKAKEKGKEYKPKKYKEDKKPKEPRYDTDKEVMARVANGEVPLVVQVHRAAELRNLLAGTAEFGRLRMIVAGGTEALTVADELAERDIPVLVWPVPGGTYLPDELEGADLGLAGDLEAEGVEVLLGSGGGSAVSSRDLPMLAALAIGHGLERESAFEALTIRAARAFDVGDRVGTIEVGKDADLLVLDGDPFGPTTRVRYVVVGGDLVVEAE